jgi:hypothetical protein
MHEQFLHVYDSLKTRALKAVGARGIELSDTHYSDDETKARFTRQGRVLIERILPSQGINLYIASQTSEQQTDV